MSRYAITHVRISKSNTDRGIVSVVDEGDKSVRRDIFMPATDSALFAGKIGGVLLDPTFVPAVVGPNGELAAPRAFTNKAGLACVSQSVYLKALGGFEPPKQGPALSAEIKAVLA